MGDMYRSHNVQKEMGGDTKSPDRWGSLSPEKGLCKERKNKEQWG